MASRYTPSVIPTDSNRYDVSGENPEMQFVDADCTVLQNLLGITDLVTLQNKEEEQLAAAFSLLTSEVRAETPLTCELIRHIHRRIFGSMYSWAGSWRTIQISKEDTVWPPPNFLDQAMKDFERDVLSTHPARALTDTEQFCTAVGHIQGEFLAIHPFREGNARTIKLATDILAEQTGRPPLRYDDSEDGTAAYIEAAKAAIGKDYEPMVTIAQVALTNAIESPE